MISSEVHYWSQEKANQSTNQRVIFSKLHFFSEPFVMFKATQWPSVLLSEKSFVSNEPKLQRKILIIMEQGMHVHTLGCAS